jgi:hypothetical protein
VAFTQSSDIINSAAVLASDQDFGASQIRQARTVMPLGVAC